jgi:hypothetical protein
MSAAAAISIPVQPAAVSAKGAVEDGGSLEVFDIPGSRSVHGNTFPLGLRAKPGAEFNDLQSAIDHVELLASRGTIHSLLTTRTCNQHCPIQHLAPRRL